MAQTSQTLYIWDANPAQSCTSSVAKKKSVTDFFFATNNKTKGSRLFFCYKTYQCRGSRLFLCYKWYQYKFPWFTSFFWAKLFKHTCVCNMAFLKAQMSVIDTKLNVWFYLSNWGVWGKFGSNFGFFRNVSLSKSTCIVKLHTHKKFHPNWSKIRRDIELRQNW